MHLLGTHSFCDFLISESHFLNWDLSLSENNGSPVFTGRDCIFKFLSSLKVTNALGGSKTENSENPSACRLLPELSEEEVVVNPAS